MVGALFISAPTNAVVAICVVNVPGEAVGAKGVPVRLVLFKLNVAACWTNWVVAMFVLLSPVAGLGAVGVPVNAGLLSGAKLVIISAKPIEPTVQYGAVGGSVSVEGEKVKSYFNVVSTKQTH